MIRLGFNSAQELLAIRELAQKQAASYPEGLFFNHTNELFNEAEKVVSHYNWQSTEIPVTMGSFKTRDTSVLYISVKVSDGKENYFTNYKVMTGFDVDFEVHPDGSWRMIGGYPSTETYCEESEARKAFHEAVSKITVNSEK